MGKRDDKNIELLAEEIGRKLDNTGYFGYYCKVAYNLSEAEIRNNLDKALKGKQPSRLFAYLCNKMIKEKENVTS